MLNIVPNGVFCFFFSVIWPKIKTLPHFKTKSREKRHLPNGYIIVSAARPALINIVSNVDGVLKKLQNLALIFV